MKQKKDRPVTTLLCGNPSPFPVVKAPLVADLGYSHRLGVTSPESLSKRLFVLSDIAYQILHPQMYVRHGLDWHRVISLRGNRSIDSTSAQHEA